MKMLYSLADATCIDGPTPLYTLKTCEEKSVTAQNLEDTRPRNNTDRTTNQVTIGHNRPSVILKVIDMTVYLS